MKKNSFVEGAFIATLAVVITKILGMLYVIPFYNIIGSQGGALYSYAYNIYTIFLDMSSAGIPTAISKIISEYNTLEMNEAKYRTFILGKKIVTYISVIGFLVMFLLADVMAGAIIGDMSGGNSPEDIAFVIRCISFAILVIPYMSIAKGYIQGHSIVTPSSVCNVLEQIVRIFVILTGSFLVYKVFEGSLTLAVGVAVSGAFFGGVAAFFYLRHKIKQNAEILGIKEYEKKDEVTNKEIVKKIVSYSIPFIIIAVATSIYNFTDMVLILRGLDMIGFNTVEAEFIQSAITTWSTKICMIISALSMGMSVSLIPNIVSSFVKKDWSDVNAKINKAYQIVLLISVPCGVGLCILSTPVWTVFYGASENGPLVLAIMVISAIFANLYSVTFNVMQSMNKFKTVYLSVFVGFLVNGLLDIPLILLFDKIGIPPYWGAPFATMIGYNVSMIIARADLRKNYKMKFKDTAVMALKIAVPTAAMVAVLEVMNHFVPFTTNGVWDSILMIVANAGVGGVIYMGIAYKMGLLAEVFGKEHLQKLVKKLTFGKVSLKV